VCDVTIKKKQTSFDLLQNLRCHTIKQNKKYGVDLTSTTI